MWEHLSLQTAEVEDYNVYMDNSCPICSSNSTYHRSTLKEDFRCKKCGYTWDSLELRYAIEANERFFAREEARKKEREREEALEDLGLNERVWQVTPEGTIDAIKRRKGCL